MSTIDLLEYRVGLCVLTARQYQMVVEMSSHVRVAAVEPSSMSMVGLTLDWIWRSLHASLHCQNQRPTLTK